MTTTLQRLVGYPHAAVFDKTPAASQVFRIDAAWVVADGVMSVRSDDYELANFTVGQLAVALSNNGNDVTELSSDFSALSALVLVEGSGTDRVTGYTSLMWVMMGGYAGVVREAGLQVVQALRQMVITQAEGEWLDLWGMLYDVARRQGESDASLAPRIPREAFRLRESPIAIEEAIKDATGKTVHIEEPWREIFTLDSSTLSGPHKLQDGERTGYFLIRPVSDTPIDWTDVMPVINRNRAAGIVVVAPFSRNRVHTDAGIDGTVHSFILREHAIEQRYEDRTLLDYSAIEDVPILNHMALHRREILHLSGSTIEDCGWSDGIWPDCPWTDVPYSVESYYYRSFRDYFSGVVYDDQYWTDIPWTDDRWSEFNVLIGSSHTSS